MKLLAIGNCQTEVLANLLMAMIEGAQVTDVRLLPTDLAQLNSGKLNLARLKAGDSDFAAVAAESDLILIQNGFEIQINRQFESSFPLQVAKVRMFPRILFTGFHPDMMAHFGAAHCPTGTLHSTIACYGWSKGLSEEETIGLFREEVFAELGFFDNWKFAADFLLEEAGKTGMSLEGYIEKWTAQGRWMHTINHPKLHVVADIARAILQREGIPFRPDVENLITDPLARHATWEVYPEIARRLGVPGGYEFKAPQGPGPGVPLPKTYDLEEFVRGSFERYAGHGRDMFAGDRLASSRYQALSRFVKTFRRGSVGADAQTASGCEAPAGAATNPYRNLPDHQFWARAIERPMMHDVDPVVRAPFKLRPEDKVATAGSCFAQHIARTLVKNGFNYYTPERGDHLDPEEAQRRNYGVFSARFGNLYTTRQLVQLFDRAYGSFKPADNAWARRDGRLVDAFRPQIEPEGFASVDELERSRAEHFAAVREMFEKCDVFVFTLGLTEAWRSRIDGAVYPLAPGVVAGEADAEAHEFVNFTAGEVAVDLQGFVDRLRRVNPRVRIILTVSPVPLIATYEDRHVLVSTTYSKSALRVAAEEICQRNPGCAYFPSYEIITGNYTKGEYYENDMRSVKLKGVDHVMRLFFKHYGSETTAESLAEELMRENAAAAEVVCDEEAIDG